MNRSHSQTMILAFKICKSHLRAFTSTVIKAQTTQRGAKSLGRDAFPVFRVISSCSGKQQRAIDQRHSHYYCTPNTSQTPLCIVQYSIHIYIHILYIVQQGSGKQQRHFPNTIMYSVVWYSMVRANSGEPQISHIIVAQDAMARGDTAWGRTHAF